MSKTFNVTFRPLAASPIAREVDCPTAPEKLPSGRQMTLKSRLNGRASIKSLSFAADCCARVGNSGLINSRATPKLCGQRWWRRPLQEFGGQGRSIKGY